MFFGWREAFQGVPGGCSYLLTKYQPKRTHLAPVPHILEDYSQYMYNQIENSFNQLKKIDSKGAFEADDETGTIFEQLKQVLTNLQEEFNAEKKKSQ